MTFILVGQNLVTWPCLDTKKNKNKKTEKCNYLVQLKIKVSIAPKEDWTWERTNSSHARILY